MFTSFFPRPRLFLLSILIWSSVGVLFWRSFGAEIGQSLGFALLAADAEPVIGLGFFITPDFIWFYIYYFIFVGFFAAFWFIFAPHRWQYWSILGSALILFSTYFGVQVSVAINHWRKPFFDDVQNALTGTGDVTASDLYVLFFKFMEIAFVAVAVFVLTRFFVSHYIFRWRNAMNDYYLSHWSRLRRVEGASQRIQEDTKQFAAIMEGLGVSVVDAVMTLFAFLPVLFSLSVHVTELPLVGAIEAPLIKAAVFWSLFGTVLLAVVGIRLPGLEFRNQRVEAAFRKELVYGEDDAGRAEPVTMTELFNNVRRNYFRLMDGLSKDPTIYLGRKRREKSLSG